MLRNVKGMVLGLVGLIGVAMSADADEAAVFPLNRGDRIALLGGTFVERLQSEGFFETELTMAFPDKGLTFRNLGWSGDTVWGDSRGVFGDRADGFKRLVNDTLAAKPTVLAIAYGQNEAFAGQAGVAEFQDGLRKLLDALAPSQARVVLIAPPKAIAVPPPLPPVEPYNEKLALYRDAIKQVAAERKVAFIDWYDFEPAQDTSKNDLKFTTNGLHWTPAAEWQLSGKMAKSFGAAPAEIELHVDIATAKATAERARIVEAQILPDKCVLTVEPARLAPAVLPLSAEADRAKQKFLNRPFARLRIDGLQSGAYQVEINGQREFGTNSQALAEGLPLTNAPDAGRGAKLRQLIQEKNVLFFHRYRPQNETYLFLFRKHEQGNNAVEIPQFDPLIAAKEKEIAKWCQPQRLTIAVTRD